VKARVVSHFLLAVAIPFNRFPDPVVALPFPVAYVRREQLLQARSLQ
jgi:hypothetical protein